MSVEPDSRLADTAAAGRRRRERAQGPRAADIQRLVASYDAELPDLLDEVVFGRLWDRPSLTHEEQMLIAITGLVMRDNQTQLRNYLYGALQDGISAAKLRDLIIMTGVYGGFPVVINARVLLAEVVAALQRKGVSIVGVDD
jgi:alkylhydroperoxidase/carboxymuconolactone decarboxylase family protein YurZ